MIENNSHHHMLKAIIYFNRHPTEVPTKDPKPETDCPEKQSNAHKIKTLLVTKKFYLINLSDYKKSK